MDDIKVTSLNNLSQINFNNLQQLIKELITFNSQLKAILISHHLTTIPLVINQLNAKQASELNRSNLTITINCNILNDWKQLVKTIYKDIWTILVLNDLQADATLYVNSCVESLVNYQYDVNLNANEDNNQPSKEALVINKPLDDVSEDNNNNNNNLPVENGVKIYLAANEEDWHCTGNKPITYYLLGNSYPVKNWTNLLTITCDVLYDKHQLGFIKHLNPSKVGKDQADFIKPYHIKNSEYYVEINYSCKDILKMIIKMLNWYQIPLDACYFILKT